MSLGNSIRKCIKAQRRFHFLDGFYLLDFFWFLQPVHTFQTRGLLIACTTFFRFDYAFLPWVYRNLFASVEKYKDGSFFWMSFFYWISSGFCNWFFHLERGVKLYLIHTSFNFTIHLFHEFGELNSQVYKSRKKGPFFGWLFFIGFLLVFTTCSYITN